MEQFKAIHDLILGATDKLVSDLYPYAEKSIFLYFPAVDEALRPLSEQVGFDLDMLKYVLAMFASYPLAFLVTLLPGKNLKHLANSLIGLWFAQQIFRAQWVHSFLSSLGTYLIVLIAPRKSSATVVFAFVMLYMSLSHLYRLHIDYLGWSLDFTGPQMILTIKLSTFAYNLSDGHQQPPKEGSKNYELQKKIYDKRQKVAIKSIPNPLEFMGYIYNFTTLLTGPAVEFQVYAKAMDGTAFAKANGSQPWNVPIGLFKLIQGVLCMALHVVGSSKFPVAACYGKMTEAPLFERWMYSWIALLFIRMKYYFAWKVAEGSCIFMNMGYQGVDKDGKHSWNGCSNMEMLDFELAGNTTNAVRAWNKGTQKWLQEYVYLRLGNSLLVTYFISAFWHGFYPGYYLFFFSIAFVTMATRQWNQTITPLFASGPLKPIYDILSTIGFNIYINYFSIVFQVLAWEYSVAVWQSFLWLGHIVTAVVYIVTSVLPKQTKSKKA